MCSSVIALTLIAFAPATASGVTATRLDGAAVVGDLRGWDDKQVLIVASAGEVRISAKELLSLQWSPAPPSEASEKNATTGQLELTDGSILPIDEFHSAGSEATATLSVPSDQRTLVLGTKQLAAVRLQPLQAAAAAQWQEIRDLASPGDVLVLLKRDGTSLDYVEGVLGDVSADKIDFKIDGEPARIDRAKVAGLIYYRGEGKSEIEPRCVVHGRSGLRAIVLQARLADGMVRLTTAGGAELNWPLDDIDLVDFSAGKLLYLGDVEPASQRWTPLVGLPAGATLAAEYGQPRRNQSAYGGPLTLSFADANSTSPTGQTRTFTKGLAVRSRTELVYRMPAGFRRLTALAGIDPASSANGSVRLQIYGDDKPLVETDISGHEPPQPIDLDVAGVKRLKIVVDYGRNLDTGDWLNLCDVRVVK